MQQFTALKDTPYIVDFARMPLRDIIRNRQIEDPLEILLKSRAFRKIASASLSPAEGILPSFERKELLELILSRISPLSPQGQSLNYFLEKVFNIDKSLNRENFDLNYSALSLQLRSSAHGLSSILNGLNIHSMHIITDIAEDIRPFSQLNSDRIIKFPAVPQIDLSDYANILSPGFPGAVKRLSAVSGNIGAMADMLSAIDSRIDSFYASGAKSIALRLDSAAMLYEDEDKAERAYKSAIESGKVKEKHAAHYRAKFINHAAAACAKRNMLFILILPNNDEPVYASLQTLVNKLLENSSLPKMIAVANSFNQFEALCSVASGAYGSNAHPAFAVRANCSVDLRLQLKTLALNNMLSYALSPMPLGASLIDIFSLPVARQSMISETRELTRSNGSYAHDALLKDMCFNNLYNLYFK